MTSNAKRILCVEDDQDTCEVLGFLLPVAACDSGPQASVEPDLTLLVVAPSVATIRGGGTVQLSLTARDENGQSRPADGAGWATSNTGVAVVTSSGVVTGRATGQAQITAYWNGASTSSTIYVVGDPPSGGQPCGNPEVNAGIDLMKLCVAK